MMPAMSVSQKSTRRVMRNTSDMKDTSRVSRHIPGIDRRRLRGHALGVEAGVDGLLALAAQFVAMGGVVEQLMQGAGQVVRILRIDEQTAAGRLDQLRE